jgi:DNA-3-methyladenine glycosylase II
VNLYAPPGADALAEARRRLVEIDPALGRLDAAVPPFEWRIRPAGFSGLARMIVEQQVSVASAAAIWGRVQTRLGEVTPEAVRALPAEELLGCGLSRPKQRYLDALAGAGVDFEALRSLDDEAAVAVLTGLKGVGRWTAETYLMFCEGRLDMFPGGDVALQEAMRWADGLEVRPGEKAAYARAERWRPYRGVAAHLLWGGYRVLRRGGLTSAS